MARLVIRPSQRCSPPVPQSGPCQPSGGAGACMPAGAAPASCVGAVRPSRSQPFPFWVVCVKRAAAAAALPGSALPLPHTAGLHAGAHTTCAPPSIYGSILAPGGGALVGASLAFCLQIAMRQLTVVMTSAVCSWYERARPYWLSGYERRCFCDTPESAFCGYAVLLLRAAWLCTWRAVLLLLPWRFGGLPMLAMLACKHDVAGRRVGGPTGEADRSRSPPITCCVWRL